MKINTIVLTLLAFYFFSCQSTDFQKVIIVQDEKGKKLQVGNEDFFIHGMNWDYFPIGTTYDYNLWDKDEEFIREALDYEMALLRNMGVNTLRQYDNIPPRWITYIYDNFGIYTVINHSFGRYGITTPDGEWEANTDYTNIHTRESLLSEADALARNYRNTPGLLMYLLGNENNYGLHWEGAATEDIPTDDTQNALDNARAMYRLFNDAAIRIRKIDNAVPVAICNGDLQYIDIIAEECDAVDVFGTNIYRGKSFDSTFIHVKEKLGMPVMLTEFGSDAYHAIDSIEVQKEQAYYLLHNWYEVMVNAYGHNNAGNVLGGFTFHFSDGWWKHLQDKNLHIHDTHASWSNGGYSFDYHTSHNNMNEEWFGICAKDTPAVEGGHYKLKPRAAYYLLSEIHRHNPYEYSTTKDLEKVFNELSIDKAFENAQNLSQNQ